MSPEGCMIRLTSMWGLPMPLWPDLYNNGNVWAPTHITGFPIAWNTKTPCSTKSGLLYSISRTETHDICTHHPDTEFRLLSSCHFLSSCIMSLQLESTGLQVYNSICRMPLTPEQRRLHLEWSQNKESTDWWQVFSLSSVITVISVLQYDGDHHVHRGGGGEDHGCGKTHKY